MTQANEVHHTRIQALSQYRPASRQSTVIKQLTPLMLMQVSKCIVHCSGALMLDPADVVRYNHHLESQHDQMSNHTSQQDTVRQPSMSHPGLFGIPSHDQPLGDGDMPESMEAPGNAGAYPHLQPGGNEEMLASGWQDQGMDDDDDNGAGDMDHYVADGNGAENASGPHGCLPMEAGTS